MKFRYYIILIISFLLMSAFFEVYAYIILDSSKVEAWIVGMLSFVFAMVFTIFTEIVLNKDMFHKGKGGDKSH